MKPSDFQKTVMCRFDSCLKKTVFGVVKDYYKELKKNQAEAIPFCELPDIIIDKVAIWDTYKTDYTTFNICGHDIYVYDDELAKVIKQLSDRYRENVLMYYFLDMSDTEIAEQLCVSKKVAYALVKSGQFAYVRAGRAIRVSKDSFDKWLNQN